MIVTVIRTWSEFGELENEWNSLLFRSRAATIFLTWEWIDAWRSAIDDSVNPYVVTVRNDDGGLVAIAPFYLASLRFLKLFRYKTLRAMADNATGAEYPDWFVLEGMESSAPDAIASALAQNSADWDLIWLRNVAGWTKSMNRICESALTAGLHVRKRKTAFSSIELPKSIGEYEQGLSSNRRQQLRRRARRIFEGDSVTIEYCESTRDLPEFLAALFELHQKRWRSVGKDGCFVRKPLEAAFYECFAPMAMANGWLRIFAIKSGEEIKAVQYGYVLDGVFSQLQEGFDPDFLKGVGNGLRHKVIENCIAEGVQIYDFLGGISDHKRNWGAEVRFGYDIMIGSRSLKTAMLFWQAIWPSGRYMDDSEMVTA